MDGIRYVVTDMDGTMLRPGGIVAPRTREAIAALKQQGIGLVLASGRSDASMKPYVQELGLALPFIAYNGAKIVDARTFAPIREDLIPLEQLREACVYIEGLGCYFQVYYGDTFYYSEQGTFAEEYQRDTRQRGQYVGKLSAFVDRPTPKVVLIAEPERASVLRGRLTQRYAGVFTVTGTNPKLVELTVPQATKGGALQRLMEILHTSAGEVMALGDAPNDITMLETAGTSVAMGGALPEVVAAADYTTLSAAEDGWADFLFTHLLPREGDQ